MGKVLSLGGRPLSPSPVRVRLAPVRRPADSLGTWNSGVRLCEHVPREILRWGAQQEDA